MLKLEVMLEQIGGNVWWLLLMFETNIEQNEFGGRFIDIGLENVAVAAASVVELPPRCSNKGGQKRRCL